MSRAETAEFNCLVDQGIRRAHVERSRVFHRVLNALRAKTTDVGKG